MNFKWDLKKELDEQRKQLSKDLNTPEATTLELFEEIKSPADKAFVLHMIRTIGHSDGDFSGEEKAAFQKIQAEISARSSLLYIIRSILSFWTNFFFFLHQTSSPWRGTPPLGEV